MTHDYIGCDDAGCQLCEAYEAGSAETSRVLLYISSDCQPDWVRRCDTPCYHPRCLVAQMLDIPNRRDGAEAWVAANREFATMLRNVLCGAHDGDDDKGDDEGGDAGRGRGRWRPWGPQVT